MLQNCIDNLGELKQLLNELPEKAYSEKLEVLSGASIGQHIRHVIELYQQLMSGMEVSEINYDSRQRDLRIETSLTFASSCIDQLCQQIMQLKTDKELILKGNFSKHQESNLLIKTTLYRELGYNLEHSIHHQALIKIGLAALDLSSLAGLEFGVASATVRFTQSGSN